MMETLYPLDVYTREEYLQLFSEFLEQNHLKNISDIIDVDGDMAYGHFGLQIK